MSDVKRGIESLFTPFNLGHLTLRNRFIMPAMELHHAKACVPSEKMAAYLRQRAEGGVSLITSEACGIDHPSGYWRPIFSRMAPDTMDAWRRIIEAVKLGGAHFVIQLWHPGAMRRLPPEAPESRFPSLSPSGLFQAGQSSGRAMTKGEIEEIKEAYAVAAVRAKALGADGVELHGAHGYLLDQFLWEDTNLREDDYGGRTLEERARFPAEVVAAIRQVVGRDFVINYRFSQFKEIDYTAKIALEPEPFRGFLSRLRQAGVDCFHVSTRRFNRPEWPNSEHSQRGLAGWVKSMTDAAVITIGSVGLTTDNFSDIHDGIQPKLQIEHDLEKLVHHFNLGEFDLIGVGRQQIANADFVRKVEEGRYDDIVCFERGIHLKQFLENLDLNAMIGESRKVGAI